MPLKELVILTASACASYATVNGLCNAFPAPSNALLFIGQLTIAAISAPIAFIFSAIGLEVIAAAITVLFSKKEDSEECNKEATRGE